MTKSTFARTCELTCKQSSADAVTLGCGHIELEQTECSDQHPRENRAPKEASCKDRAWSGASVRVEDCCQSSVAGTEARVQGPLGLQNDLPLLTH